jgi:hypothetical protein
MTNETAVAQDEEYEVRQKQERALRNDLNRLDKTETVGPLSMITVPRPKGGDVYLSGIPYLFSNFSERAYMIGEHTAHELIIKHPVLLKDAKVHVRRR